MSFFQRVVHHLVNEVLVSGLANRCAVAESPTDDIAGVVVDA